MKKILILLWLRCKMALHSITNVYGLFQVLKMVEENCIVCALKQTIWFTSFCGIPPFFIDCSHKDGVSKLKIVKSRFHSITWFIMLAITTALCFHYATLVITFNDQDVAVLFFNIIGLSDSITIMTILTISYYKSKHFENSLIMSNTYLQRWKLAHCEPLLTKKNCLVDTAVLIMCYIWVAIMISFTTVKIDSSLPLAKILSKIARLLNHVEVMMAVSFNILLEIYINICRNCQKFIKRRLDRRIAYVQMGNRTNLAVQYYTVKLMKHYRILYVMLHKVTQQFNKYYNPTLIIIFLLITLNPITNTLLLIYGSHSQNFTMDEVWGTLLQLVLVCLMGLISMQQYENYSKIHDDFVSYLFKYPISKLHNQEALEIEITIKFICRHKPEIKLAEMITPGAKLIAPYLGTILTYILVIINFVKQNEKTTLNTNRFTNKTTI